MSKFYICIPTCCTTPYQQSGNWADMSGRQQWAREGEGANDNGKRETTLLATGIRFFFFSLLAKFDSYRVLIGDYLLTFLATTATFSGIQNRHIPYRTSCAPKRRLLHHDGSSNYSTPGRHRPRVVALPPYPHGPFCNTPCFNHGPGQ